MICAMLEAKVFYIYCSIEFVKNDCYFFYMCQNVKQTKYAATSVKFPASYFVSDEKLREQRRRQISLGVTL